jgi:4-hydroxybenzoate polyprenyltransferase
VIGVQRNLRTRDWWSSKIPPLLAVAYAVILVGNVDWRQALPALLRLLLSIVGVAGYGYVLNDVFDVEEDRRRGKTNSMAGFNRYQQAALLLLLASLGLAPMVGGPFGRVSVSLVVLNLALPMLYSIPPVRLKERGIFGVVADAMGVHVVPTLFFAISMAGLGDGSSGLRTTGLIAAAGLWALMAGSRGIIVHQVRDRESDLSAGVKTFGGTIDPGAARTVVFRLMFPAELLALSVLLITVIPAAPILIGVIPVYLSFELLKVLDDWKLPIADADNPGGEPYVPLEHNDLYEVWLPLSLSVQLAARALPFAILSVVHLVVFAPSIRGRLADMVSLSPVILWFLAGKGRAPLCIASFSESDASAQGFALRKASNEVRVFVGVDRWCLNGVNLFSADLVRGLRKRGLEAVILLTGESGDGIGGAGAETGRPADVPFVGLPANRDSRWGGSGVAMIRFLEHQAPCVYVPNGDLRHSSLLPLLSDKVGVARVAHYDMDHIAGEYRKVFEEKERLGERTYRRSGGALERVAAFARLYRISRERSSTGADPGG